MSHKKTHKTAEAPVVEPVAEEVAAEEVAAEPVHVDTHDMGDSIPNTVVAEEPGIVDGENEAYAPGPAVSSDGITLAECVGGQQFRYQGQIYKKVNEFGGVLKAGNMDDAVEKLPTNTIVEPLVVGHAIDTPMDA